MKNFYRYFFAMIFITLITSGCGSNPPFALFAAETPTATLTPIPTFTPTATLTPEPTATLIPSTATPTITPTPQWVFVSGKIICPILLYHRIAESDAATSLDSRYYVTPQDFDDQMKALRDWGYTSIPISLLVKAIMTGAELPPRPIVLTFDDGDITVFKQAYPIMEKYGFQGVAYIVGNRIGANGFMDVDQLSRLVKHGWEIGSHSMTHADLNVDPAAMYTEGMESKLLLEKTLHVSVDTFAYPFGQKSPEVVDKIYKYGYFGAVGVGGSYQNALSNLYYLARIEIFNGTDRSTFASLLPWSGTSQ
jgi:peptidoglycan/xylan/chitin deacetylase (PgdA/CDA1 family)